MEILQSCTKPSICLIFVNFCLQMSWYLLTQINNRHIIYFMMGNRSYFNLIDNYTWFISQRYLFRAGVLSSYISRAQKMELFPFIWLNHQMRSTAAVINFLYPDFPKENKVDYKIVSVHPELADTVTQKMLGRLTSFQVLWNRFCPACRTTFIATRFRVAVICPIIQVPHCIRVFFYFVWFVFINHIFQFYYELCTYCNILDIYLS